ncbi:MAG: hypothetical protein ABS68_06035 [Niastella sp. SCN 39-18]|nr:MAG: hypothetical protein ABS68_06035 [Niastella sp. SCN 39-18]OJW08556.1 MAG: hypothetical protein BGO53_09995 [Sphingobacteriales bacterium 39-19]
MLKCILIFRVLVDSCLGGGKVNFYINKLLFTGTKKEIRCITILRISITISHIYTINTITHGSIFKNQNCSLMQMQSKHSLIKNKSKLIFS